MAFLSRLDPSNPQHQRLMEELVTLLLKKVRNKYINIKITKTNKQKKICETPFALL